MTAAEKSLKNYQTKRQVQAIALVTLVVQNSALALLMRYSRRVPVKEGSLYAASTAVVCAEVVKVAASLLLQLKDDRDLRGLWQTVKRDIFCQPWDTQKMAVPAALYCMQNNLAYIAISNLDSPTYQLLYQMKILTTATFSVTLLGHALNAQQWASLCMLVAGVGLVQLTQNSTARSSYSSSGGSSSEFAQNSMMGLAAVAAACVTSGFAGVYFEKVLKASNVSIWIRNMQLAGYGAAIGLAGVYAGPDARAVVEHGFLYGYNWKVWGAVLLNSLGGLVVAVVVKYADNVVKGFATSISILMTSIFSLVFFNFNFNIRFMAGAAMVIYSTYLYGQVRPVASAAAAASGQLDRLELNLKESDTDKGDTVAQEPLLLTPQASTRAG